MSIKGERKPYNWRLLGVLVVAILVSVILITPYSLSLQADTLATVKPPLPLTILIPLQWVGTTVLYGIIAGIGLLIAGRIGLGLPFLESWLAGKPEWGRVQAFWWRAILAGVVVGGIIIVLDRGIFAPYLVEVSNTSQGLSSNTPIWMGLLGSFYGGITEEILLRLFLLSLFAWIGRLIRRRTAGRPGTVTFWVANILAAVIFGLGHLPVTMAMGLPLDAVVITRAIVLNGLGGVVFGWFYWTYGLEAAMVSHFSADIVLRGIGGLLGGS